MILFCYARRPFSKDHYVNSGRTGKLSDFTAAGRVVLNPSISHYCNGAAFDKAAFVSDPNLLCSNGVVVVCGNGAMITGSACGLESYGSAPSRRSGLDVLPRSGGCQ